jgi:hypothetical protein
MAEWKQLSGTIGLAPDFIQQIKPPIEAIFETINLTLDLLQDILSFVKNFLIDFTQPIKLIIDALVAQLKALLLDIKQLGIYWTSDADLIPQMKKDGLAPFSNGYASFQNRMVQKLTDLDDFSRPNFSNATGTISLFVYASGDVNSIITAINAVLNFIALFTKTKEETPDPDPVNIQGVLKNGILPIDLKRESDFNRVSISWDIVPPPNASGKPFPSFVNPPKSFLVHIRTSPNPLYIGYKYRPNNSTEIGQTLTSTYYLTKNIPALVNGGVSLYSGVDDTTIFLDDPDSDIEYKKADIEDTGITLYYAPSTIGSFLAGNTYTLSLEKSVLPKTYEYKYKNGSDNKKTVESKTLIDTTKLYVEVVSCDTDLGLEDGDSVVDQITLLKDSRPNIQVQTSIRTTPIRARGEVGLPLPETSKFISALKDALAIYLLGGYYKDTSMGLSNTTQANIKAYLNKLPTDTELLTDVIFKNQVDTKIGVIVNKMNMPDQSIIQSLEKDINNLTKPYLIDPANPNGEKITFYNLVGDFGISRLIPGVTYDKNSIASLLSLTNKSSLNENLPDNLPVLYSANTEVKPHEFNSQQASKIQKAESVRSVIEITKGGEGIAIKDSAKNFLEFLPRRRPVIRSEGAWSNIRFFEDGIPEFEQFMKLIINFLESLSFSLDGIIKAIRQYIDIIILRIEEIQALINKIKGLINFLLNLKIGGNVALLYSVNEGTRGIVENLINSQSKPPFNQGESLGFGGCFVFGGYPTFLPALLQAFAG